MTAATCWSTQPAPARAEPPTAVVWVDSGRTDDAPRMDALRLELRSRGVLLVTTSAPVDLVATTDGAEAPVRERGADARAADALAATTAVAAFWLEGDAERQVTWLKVRLRDGRTERAPLPHPPDAIAASLFAVAAASLIDDVLASPSTGATVPSRLDTTETADGARAADSRAPITAPAASARASSSRPKPREKSLPTWFVRVGALAGAATLDRGWEADRDPPADRVFIGEGGESFIDDQSPWIPDADTVDSFGRLGGHCEADGISTEPGEMPSKFCARLAKPGASPLLALEVAAGRWLTAEVAVTAFYRFFANIEGESFFGNSQLGAQGEYLVLGDSSRRFNLAVLLGVALGRTETPVPQASQQDESLEPPDALSGPLDVQGGMRARAALSERLALAFDLELSFRPPEAQIGAALSAGLEFSL